MLSPRLGASPFLPLLMCAPVALAIIGLAWFGQRNVTAESIPRFTASEAARGPVPLGSVVEVTGILASVKPDSSGWVLLLGADASSPPLVESWVQEGARHLTPGSQVTLRGRIGTPSRESSLIPLRQAVVVSQR